MPTLSYPLHCHPDTPHPAIAGIIARAVLTSDGSLAISYVLEGDLSGLDIPSTPLTGSADRLWENTCFEAFVGHSGTRAYREFNFSPSGQWAAYAFSGYRMHDISLQPDMAVPQIAQRRFADRLELDVVLDRLLLPEVPSDAKLQVGLAAVMKSIDGMRTYWALAHPPGKPDFHHRSAFALTPEAPMLPVETISA